MKLLASVSFVLTALVVSLPAVAGHHDFSKTAAARSDYRFADNQPAQTNVHKQVLIQHHHDFSKTTAAHGHYDFNENLVAPQSVNPTSHHQHDFSKTEAVRNEGYNLTGD